GTVWYKGKQTIGNIPFINNQTVTLEFDSEKGTLFFFVGGAQQPVCITGIKEKIRFIIFMHFGGSICTIGSLKKLEAPTSVQIANKKAIQW
ncbi:MAG: hypothetical protein EZS28_004478, partial [Streblomastix strix]